MYVKCADGTELSEDAVSTAITTADAKFAVTEFTMTTPDEAPETE